MLLKKEISLRLIRFFIKIKWRYPRLSKVLLNFYYKVLQWRCLNYSYFFIRVVLLLQKKDLFPIHKNEILILSNQFQKEWRFQKDLQLMQHALNLYPDWKYALQRLEWHSRPIFHKDPVKSKTQPRKPLRLPRDAKYIPQKNTLKRLCFVTGASSNAPYFELVVQLIESIKATKYYHNIPIKILDCGLTKDDYMYLVKRFNVEIKDPGWDVNFNLIEVNGRLGQPKNGWKGVTSRPYIYKHFPGYEYYFWIDTDAWVQSENALDKLIYLCEKQGIGIPIERFEASIWSKTHSQGHPSSYTLSDSFYELIENKKSFFNSAYCITQKMCEQYAKDCEVSIYKMGRYIWGADLAILNYTIYSHLTDVMCFDDASLHPNLSVHTHYAHLITPFCLEHRGLYIDEKPIGIFCLAGEYDLKTSPFRILFSNKTLKENIKAYHMSKFLSQRNTALAEEIAHQYCKRYGWDQGSYFYRTYGG